MGDSPAVCRQCGQRVQAADGACPGCGAAPPERGYANPNVGLIAAMWVTLATGVILAVLPLAALHGAAAALGVVSLVEAITLSSSRAPGNRIAGRIGMSVGVLWFVAWGIILAARR